MKTFESTAPVTIRYGREDDDDALAALAQLDSQDALDGAVLVGEVAGQIWAAVSLSDYRVVADPFRPSGELAFLLVERARQLRRHEGRRRRRAFRPAYAA
jgi:hypothetical protein